MQRSEPKGDSLLILGAGYVGEAVARAGLARGWRVGALTRNEQRLAELRELGAEGFLADLAEGDWSAAVGGGWSFAVNCVGSGGAGVESYRRSYVEGMRATVAWAAQAKPKVLVYTSSTSVYPQTGGVAVDETASTEPSNERAALLLETERLALGGSRAEGERRYVLRLAGIYGPERHYLLDQLKAGETVLAGDGDRRLNLIHRDDIVAAIFACLDAGPDRPDGVFNVASDEAPRKQEVVAWLAEQIGAVRPEFLGRADPRAKRRGVKMPDRVIVSERIRREMGWRPRFPTFREGYADLLGR
jgi:nucleoside-diphosphate-sugar epimerase